MVNAALELTSNGALVLIDVDDTLVWSTGNSNSPVALLELAYGGNLKLVSGGNVAVWQSFDHPTHTWPPGQSLSIRRILICSISTSNFSTGVVLLPCRNAANGTPGHIAPELIYRRNVSVKVDVYSFGIVILEIVCRRKNMDLSQGEYLIDIVKRKAEEDQLSDLVDNCKRRYGMPYQRSSEDFGGCYLVFATLL
ncbi:hypothetical protein F0562_010555 [Nyssa sinensis]|uniref:Bulb-type lectin domain-containing protein n=1 Tax=Nyssa sinensis TaxID=561372 RepID=A0A5J5A1F3_9ASTE|nr:hypothetical protein F0562_010555 [Nyssa sinensis]